MHPSIYRFWHYYFEQGGLINVLIFATAVVIFYCAIDAAIRLFRFGRLLPSTDQFTAWLNGTDTTRPVPESFVHAFSDIRRYDSVQPVPFYINRFRELLIAETDRLDRGLETMAAWIGVAPLLGLFGTVIGMTQTFGVITRYGIGNPTLLAEGISLSLITTQTGLIVAFPGLLLHTVLANSKEKQLHRLIQLGETTFHPSAGESNAL